MQFSAAFEIYMARRLDSSALNRFISVLLCACVCRLTGVHCRIIKLGESAKENVQKTLHDAGRSETESCLTRVIIADKSPKADKIRV